MKKLINDPALVVAEALLAATNSLEMAGTSVTLLEVDDELLSWWDAPVRTPALHWGI